MFLIGQYDSPFVRRVAVALRLYDLPFEQRPWSVFGDAEKIAAYNPLIRVPTLVLDDGEVLIESGVILDHLDGLVSPDDAMIARAGDMRRHTLKTCALAMGLADKAVSLFYEGALCTVPGCGVTGRALMGQAQGVARHRHPLRLPSWASSASPLPSTGSRANEPRSHIHEA